MQVFHVGLNLEGSFPMGYPLQNFVVDCFLHGNPLNCLQGSFLRLYLNNFFIKFNYLGLIVGDLLVEDFRLKKTLPLLVFKLVELSFTGLTRVPFKLCLTEFRLNLRLSILS